MRPLILLCASLLSLATLVLGCASKDDSPKSLSTASHPAVAEKSGTQLWTDNCARCHNLRSPETFSPGQWEVIVHHMRLRANLTGDETRKITDFLKAAS